MKVPRLRWLCGVLAAVAALAIPAAAVPAVAEEGPLTAAQLVYREVPLEFQADVNGEAAVQLIGGALDAAAEIAREHLPSLQKMLGSAPAHGEGELTFFVGAAGALIDPARDAAKSITHITVLVMTPDKPVRFADIHSHYNGLMTQRGWMPLATVRVASDDTGVLLLLAPGGKGLFGVLRPESSQLVVAMITANKPLGDLIAQIVRAGGAGLVPGLLGMRMSRQAPEASPPSAAPPHSPEAPAPPQEE